MINITDMIYSYKDKPFDWKTNNCVIFYIDIIKDLYGVEFGKVYRKYSKEQEFLDLINSHGNFETFLDNITNTNKKSIKEAETGDLVFMELKDNPFKGIAGICTGKRAYFLTQKGCRPLHIKKCKYVWKLKEILENN